MDIAEFHAIGEIDPSRWDEVAGDNVFALHGWLRTVEETSRSPRPSRYWVLYDGGAILAALPAILHEKTDAPSELDRSLFSRIAPVAQLLGLAATPALVCGPALGPGPSILVRPGLPPYRRAKTVGALVRAVEERADANGWTICLRGVPPRDEFERATLDPRRYRRSLDWPSAALDVCWNSIEDFQRALKKSHGATEKNMRRRLNQLRRAGIEIEALDDVVPHAQTLHRILDRHFQRKNGVPFFLGVDFATSLKRYLGDRALVRVARCGARFLGVSIVLRAGQTVYLKMIGIDETHRLRSATYHALAYYSLIEKAAAAGVRRLDFGTLAYDPKVHLGSALVDRSLLIRARGPIQDLALRALLPVRSHRIEQKVRRFRDAAAPGSFRA